MLLGWANVGPSVTTAWANPAKTRYLRADTCLKKLRNNPADSQRISAWLSCIEKYENIYQRHPSSSWAPAGMYKAAELYLKLYKRSANRTYVSRSRDLLTRIKRRYPQSAYSRRSRTLEKTIADLPSPKVEDNIKTLKSKKAQTRDDAAIARYKANLNEADTPEDIIRRATEAPSAPKTPISLKKPVSQPPKVPVPKGDTKVTGLRFWSNPEYTRIVVNADHERPYVHRLLKKDPKINKPFQRLYVDIEKARLGQGVAEHTPINDDLLKQARAGQYQPHTVRVVVDIKAFENYKIFSLKDPFRIVIDVWGENGSAKDPMKEMQATLDTPAESTPEKTDRVTTDNLKSSDIARQLALGVRKIVIDPGHGGKDPGAPGYVKGIWEKDIVLKLAKTLAQQLRSRLNCEVQLTRETDKKLTLEERTAIANTQRADLFISMHCNAARNKKLAGIETYILNLATDDQAIAVAARENATSEKNISDLEYILSDLMKHAKIEESTRLANDVHKSMVKGMKTKYSHINDLGVKQAPFYVLLGARMPSILVEASFISNKRECKRLMTESYRRDICNAITDGVEAYINATNPKHL
ncbi:MAG TPA: N-acetylmuramoyl-L-alanine amidase [Desulfobacteraceae bacterium]|nr:N-acetylmuramoyl-L-alanine amidase [Desulfobacteraceae bacterium]